MRLSGKLLVGLVLDEQQAEDLVEALRVLLPSTLDSPHEGITSLHLRDEMQHVIELLVGERLLEEFDNSHQISPRLDGLLDVPTHMVVLVPHVLVLQGAQLLLDSFALLIEVPHLGLKDASLELKASRAQLLPNILDRQAVLVQVSLMVVDARNDPIGLTLWIGTNCY
jgi:hypothetical protein